MNWECAFDLTLRGSALRSLTLEQMTNACEVSGTIGRIVSVRLVEDDLLEIRGTGGEMRISVPRELLDALRPSSGKPDTAKLNGEGNRGE